MPSQSAGGRDDDRHGVVVVEVEGLPGRRGQRLGRAPAWSARRAAAAEAVNHGAIAVRSAPCLPGQPLIVRRSVAQTNALTGCSRSRSSADTLSVTSAVTRSGSRSSARIVA